jgi:hypothetical protein
VFFVLLCLLVVAAAANIRSMYKTVYQAAFWTMKKTEQQLPQDLNALVQMLALQRQQQQPSPQSQGVKNREDQQQTEQQQQQ